MSLQRSLCNLLVITTCAKGLRHVMLVSSSRVRLDTFLQSALTTEFDDAKHTQPLRERQNNQLRRWFYQQPNWSFISSSVVIHFDSVPTGSRPASHEHTTLFIRKIRLIEKDTQSASRISVS